MSRSRPLFIHLTLILMQLLVPWVHAHTGGETQAYFHVPGLERLTPGAAGAAGGVDSSAIEMIDIMIGVPAGIEQAGDEGRGEPDDPVPAGLLQDFPAVPGLGAGPCPGASAPPPFPARRVFRPGAPPRASPFLAATLFASRA